MREVERTEHPPTRVEITWTLFAMLSLFIFQVCYTDLAGQEKSVVVRYFVFVFLRFAQRAVAA
jgi:hypothetical protein